MSEMGTSHSLTVCPLPPPSLAQTLGRCGAGDGSVSVSWLVCWPRSPRLRSPSSCHPAPSRLLSGFPLRPPLFSLPPSLLFLLSAPLPPPGGTSSLHPGALFSRRVHPAWVSAGCSVRGSSSNDSQVRSLCPERPTTCQGQGHVRFHQARLTGIRSLPQSRVLRCDSCAHSAIPGVASLPS